MVRMVRVAYSLDNAIRGYHIVVHQIPYVTGVSIVLHRVVKGRYKALYRMS